MAQITNSATAAYSYGNGSRSSSVSNVAVTELLDEYSISATKYSIGETFRPGGTITYAIQVTNTGTSSLYAITVSDDLEATGELTYADGSAYVWNGESFSLITPTSTNPLVFELSEPLTSGKSVFVAFVATVSSTLSSETTSITNVATVSAHEGSAEGDLITVDPSPTTTVTLEDYAELSITKTASASQVTTGEEFSYTLKIVNSGNSTASEVIITDTLPEGFTVSSIVANVGGTDTTLSSGDYDIDSLTNLLTIGFIGSATISLDAGEEISVTINGSF